MSEQKPRDTRLVNKVVLDEPSKILCAGSNEEFDIISEWSSCELVESVQELDEKLYKLEQAYEKVCRERDQLKAYNENSMVNKRNIGDIIMENQELRKQAEALAFCLQDILAYGEWGRYKKDDLKDYQNALAIWEEFKKEKK